MRDFKKLKIWQKGFSIVLKTFQYSKSLPQAEKFAMFPQIIKAAISIPANIAEGSGRKSQKEYGRYVEYSLASSFELETHLLISQELRLGNINLLPGILHDICEEQRMLSSFLSILNDLKT